MASGSGVTLGHLLAHGSIKPGDQLNYRDQTGTITANGLIKSDVMKGTYDSPSMWCTAVVRWNRDVKTAVNGWVHARIGKTLLDVYRQRYLDRGAKRPATPLSDDNGDGDAGSPPPAQPDRVKRRKSSSNAAPLSTPSSSPSVKSADGDADRRPKKKKAVVEPESAPAALPDPPEVFQSGLIESVIPSSLFHHTDLCGSCTAVCDPNETIACPACSQTFHLSCTNICAAMSNVPQDKIAGELVARGWRCFFCLCCETCLENEPEASLLVCERCDRAQHIQCLPTPLDAVPDGAWLCDSCGPCRNCGSSVASDSPTGVWAHNFTLCEPCGKLKDEGNECPACSKLYDEDTPSMVCCDCCEKWIHSGCLGMSEEAYEALSHSKEPFVCPSCNEAQSRADFMVHNVPWRDLRTPSYELDVMDREGDWCVARVVRSNPVTRSVTFHYVGWGRNFDEEIPFEDLVGRVRLATAESTLGFGRGAKRTAIVARPDMTGAQQQEEQKQQRPQQDVRIEIVMPVTPPKSPPGESRGKANVLGILTADAQVVNADAAALSCKLCGGAQHDALTGRLVFVSVQNGWVHTGCALWSAEVYEREDGAMAAVPAALARGKSVRCAVCKKAGATLGCCASRCSSSFHLSCAVRSGCGFYADKTTFCSNHQPAGRASERLDAAGLETNLRKLYVPSEGASPRVPDGHARRLGSFTLLQLGTIAAQRPDMHSASAIFPAGYRAARLSWSTLSRGRVRYLMSIDLTEDDGPLYRIAGDDGCVFEGSTAQAAYDAMASAVAAARERAGYDALSPSKQAALDFFGLSLPPVRLAVERLEGAACCSRYQFAYIRREDARAPSKPVVVENLFGAARLQPHVARALPAAPTKPTSSFSQRASASAEDEEDKLRAPAAQLPTLYRTMNSSTSGYRVMPSGIHGAGLFVMRPYEAGEMIIEYKGLLVGQKVADIRERQYDQRGIGTYMFRLAEDLIIDATFAGNAARFVNHSCTPNCFAANIAIDGARKVIICAARRIEANEELTYDYKFAIEENNKIACHCGSARCTGFMN